MKINDEIIIIVIFIILFAINIVAKSIFGASISPIINLCLFKFDSFNWFLFVGVSEKKAISDPEINPEKINNIIQEKRGVKIL